MSRSGYVYGNSSEVNLWRGAVTSAIKGKRGQAFLRELAEAMDNMPVKRLITNELVNRDGEVCAIGVVCKARGMSNSTIASVDPEEPSCVGDLVGIAEAMAAEIEFLNDERLSRHSPEERWQDMRAWVESQLEGARE